MSTQVHTVRAILLSIFVLGFLFAAVPAEAQFVCLGNATGAAVGNGLPDTNADGAGATASGTTSANLACGQNANASGNNSANTATGFLANASGDTSFNIATGFEADAH